MPHEKHLASVLETLKLKDANPCSTPHLSMDRPAVDPPIAMSTITTFRSCTMILNYMAADRLDVMRDIRELTQRMKSPAGYDMKHLKHVARYLGGTDDLGIL